MKMMKSTDVWNLNAQCLMFIALLACEHNRYRAQSNDLKRLAILRSVDMVRVPLNDRRES